MPIRKPFNQGQYSKIYGRVTYKAEIGGFGYGGVTFKASKFSSKNGRMTFNVVENNSISTIKK